MDTINHSSGKYYLITHQTTPTLEEHFRRTLTLGQNHWYYMNDLKFVRNRCVSSDVSFYKSHEFTKLQQSWSLGCEGSVRETLMRERVGNKLPKNGTQPKHPWSLWYGISLLSSRMHDLRDKEWTQVNQLVRSQWWYIHPWEGVYVFVRKGTLLRMRFACKPRNYILGLMSFKFSRKSTS